MFISIIKARFKAIYINRVSFLVPMKITFIWIYCAFCLVSCSNIYTTYIGEGWSHNSVNTVKFRKNAITTYKGYQFIAYYDQSSFLVLGKRKINTSKWNIVKTQYKGNTVDAHNDISIAIDGNGYLHVSWDHHDTALRYAKSLNPLSLQLTDEIAMTGSQEDKVTYPEFYNMPNGNLLFFYRSGASGRGNLVINSYDVVSKEWTQIQSNLIDGEDKRSAYWQVCVDSEGVVHVSWVWRETWNVETNHDLCYARSKDGGKTWEKSTGETYKLPITIETAELAWRIPQNSNLINQTSMCSDKKGNPYIVTYFNENKIPQYQVIYLEANHWKKINTGFRTSSFVLGGGGTKKIPIARPDILMDDSKNQKMLYILFRDEERGNKVSLAYSNLKDGSIWKVKDLSEQVVGQWEPNYDMSLWKSKKELSIFVQNVTQIDGEGLANTNASEIQTLEVKNLRKLIK
ncbi:BNR repeat-containing protein [Confluentibacter sediminis]|uniref:BNR repeat-containing protein n=1 Tax=Confluentibacter sediminis TaxID=2219045 RepID=UPI001F352B3F|nr:BNR repeat-containing protein [Confluentibacter sediminis]